MDSFNICQGSKPFLIAELSANHDSDLVQALALVDIAAEAGWDSVKFQTYDADSLTVPSNHPSMKIDEIWGADNLYDLYKSAQMPMEFHRPLFERAREHGLVPFTSVYDPRDMNFVEALDCPIYKIASFEMTFDCLLIEIAKTGKPVIMSTGMANLREVDHAVNLLTKHSCGPLVLLHCCSSYPTPVDEANLSAMDTLRKRFGCPVGFSDHTIGTAVPLAAAALGATAIEKHFTNDINRLGPDHRFSATPGQMKTIADGVRDIYAAKGDGSKETRDIEYVSKEVGRRSAFTLCDLPTGHVISEGDFRFVRPGAGIPANRKVDLLGKTLKNPLPQYYPITYDDLVD